MVMQIFIKLIVLVLVFVLVLVNVMASFRILFGYIKILVRCGHCAKPWPCTSPGKLSGWQHLLQVGDFSNQLLLWTRKSSAFDCCMNIYLVDRCAFVLPTYEIHEAASLPQDKSQLALLVKRLLPTISNCSICIIDWSCTFSHQTPGEAVPLKSFGECQ